MDNIGREDEHREFKKSLAELERGVNALAAMLNKDCKGEVLFGVRDNGDVIGQEIGKETLKTISQAIANSIDPPVVPCIEVEHTSDDRTYISVKVSGKERPYLCRGVVYIRSGEEILKAPASEVRKMFRDSGDPTTEETSNDQVLSFSELCAEMKDNGLEAKEDRSLYTSFNMLDEDGRFNLLAQIVSDQNPFHLNVVVFSGTDRSIISVRKDYSNTSLVRETKSVLEYVESLNDRVVDMSGPIRKETDLFDRDAFREAWINACVHNSWIGHIPPAVYIFDDRLEILSYGGPPYWLPEDDFFSGRSMPVNESLMRIFIAVGLCEHTGHGVPEIIKPYGKGVYSIDNSGVCVTLPFTKARPNTGIRGATESLSNNAMIVLDAVTLHHDYTMQQLATLTGLSRSTVARMLSELKSKGLVEREGSLKTGNWIVHRGNDRQN